MSVEQVLTLGFIIVVVLLVFGLIARYMKGKDDNMDDFDF